MFGLWMVMKFNNYHTIKYTFYLLGSYYLSYSRALKIKIIIIGKYITVVVETVSGIINKK